LPNRALERRGRRARRTRRRLRVRQVARVARIAAAPERRIGQKNARVPAHLVPIGARTISGIVLFGHGGVRERPRVLVRARRRRPPGTAVRDDTEGGQTAAWGKT